jgi:hypothetical protein
MKQSTGQNAKQRKVQSIKQRTGQSAGRGLGFWSRARSGNVQRNRKRKSTVHRAKSAALDVGGGRDQSISPNID